VLLLYQNQISYYVLGEQYSRFFLDLKNQQLGFMPVILVTWEAEIRRITV
jgi:hypothetical protein